MTAANADMLETAGDKRPQASALKRPRVNLRILETTDLHMQVTPYDYFADAPSPATGLALTATLIREMRREAPDALLFDNGDFLQGNPVADFMADQGVVAPDAAPPLASVMNSLHYDAACLGNHEFDYGLPYLSTFLRGVEFPIVSANIQSTLTRPDAGHAPLVVPWTILDRALTGSDGAGHRIRIGVIGFLPPQVAAWEKLSLGGQLETQDIAEAARPHLKAMRAAGADIVVALSHSGIDDARDGKSADTASDNQSVQVAALKGVDVVLAGHTHKVFPGPDHPPSAHVDPVAGRLCGKPAVMAGAYGSHLGVIDLTLEKQPTTGWSVAHSTSRALPIARKTTPVAPALPRVTPDAQVMSIMGPAHDAALKAIREPVAETTAPLSTHFVYAGLSSATTLLADFLRDHARRVLPKDLARKLPLIAAVSPSGAGGRAGPHAFVDIPPGPLTPNQAAKIYPYLNGLCVLRLTGADIRDWLEVSATAFAAIKPGQSDQPLRNLDRPSFYFDILYGLTYCVDPSAPVGGRIFDIRKEDGLVLDPEDNVHLVTNSFRAGGGGGYDMAARGALVYSEPCPLRSALIEALRQAGKVHPVARPVWRFARLPSTSAWLDTSPEAARYTSESHDALHFREHTPEGFARYGVCFDVEDRCGAQGTRPALERG